jgi:hypothetical protein
LKLAPKVLSQNEEIRFHLALWWLVIMVVGHHGGRSSLQCSWPRAAHHASIEDQNDEDCENDKNDIKYPKVRIHIELKD